MLVFMKPEFATLHAQRALYANICDYYEIVPFVPVEKKPAKGWHVKLYRLDENIGSL